MKRQEKNRNRTLFFRAFFITALLLAAAIFAVYGSAKAYSAIRKNGFGESRQAVAVEKIDDGYSLRFFDFETRF